MINLVIKIRKKTNKVFGGLWVFLGRNARKILRKNLLMKYTSKKIGPYGPFKMTPEFLFSNLEEWGSGHNNGFIKYVEESKNKKCILDIGAHAGFTVLPVSININIDAKLYAFEPSTENFKALQNNLLMNGCDNVFVENCLVGEEKNDNVSFYERDDICATSSIVNNLNRKFNKTSKKQITIDLYCNAHNIKPDLIKIDVEGAEIDVLRGARKTISKFKPIIFLSVHPREIRALGYSEQDLLYEIHKNNYKLTNIDGSKVDEFAYIEYILKYQH
ncbi:FkbM family methyltransferase [Methylophilaceae bacterium]|nr:FkbM family methyltransferase [Methylophilaceae bacterium]